MSNDYIDDFAKTVAMQRSVINWRPFTKEVVLVPGTWYLLSNGYEMDVGKYSVENVEGLFCVFGHYIARNDCECKYEHIANVYLPEV